MANFPFPPKAKAAPAAEAAPAEAAAPAEKAPKQKKSGADRKKPAPAMTSDQVKQIIALVKDHSYSQIAETVGVTKFQVNRVLMATKVQLRENAKGDAAKLAKVEEYIKTYLNRPEDSRPGKGGARGGKVKGALDNVVGDILASIG
jgi:hypothetical protein